jgi:hypothetical protein
MENENCSDSQGATSDLGVLLLALIDRFDLDRADL